MPFWLVILICCVNIHHARLFVEFDWIQQTSCSSDLIYAPYFVSGQPDVCGTMADLTNVLLYSHGSVTCVQNLGSLMFS